MKMSVTSYSSEAATFTIGGLDELEAKLEQCQKEIPDQENLAMKRCARDWRKDINAKMPSYYKDIPKKWKSTYEYNSLGMIAECTIASKAPQWHLVENGHRKFDFHGHDTGGIVPGRHYAADTNAEWEDKFPEELEKQLDRVLTEAGFS